ncbi:MAG TPA: histidinol dehydrogenase, partial [Gemmatimonadales bacterium]|nr:histidinol dehydrogenase [Gemmatimonadales bacterium]
MSAEALAAAQPIVEGVRARAEAALREYAQRFGEIRPGEPIVIERPALERALGSLDPVDRERLERVAGRIRAFAEAQRRSLV